MDTKSWPWKKRSSDKAIVAGGEGEKTPGANRVADLERSMENLNGKLSYVLSECKAKDDLATKQAKAAEEALAGWEKTKEEAASLKQNLDKALQQRLVSEERASHLDAALKECMQQLRFVREEQEQRIHDAVMKTSREHEKKQMVFEEKLAETNKSVSKLGDENTHLSKTIQMKEKSIEDLKKLNGEAEAEINALMAKLDSMQKDNASMNYELRMLEKELEIRNEERVFNRRSNDASHKQHLESVKKIAKLETECQRLRLLVRKRLPGPAALARMKDEVDMLKDEAGTTTRHENSPCNNVNYLIERLCDIEEENKTLKEAMSKKSNELQSSRTMCARTASKLSQVEAQLAELSKGGHSTTPRSLPVPRRLSFASESEINTNDDAESWPSLSISEVEKTRRSPSCRSSDISLMDDFVEMEKLAIVCMEKSSSETCSKELVLLPDSHSGEQESRPKEVQSGLNESICKIIELIERITLQSAKDVSSKHLLSDDNGSSLPTGYTYRVFQWKNTELNHVLRQFVHTCKDLLNGKAEFENFAGQLSSTFDWIMNHCFSLQDVSSMRDAIKKHYGWDESQSESEHGTDKPQRNDLEVRLRSATDRINALLVELQEREKSIADLTIEVEALKASNTKLEDGTETHKLLKEDLNTQLTVVRVELGEVRQKFSCLEAELEDRKKACQELEKTCLEQKLQVESLTKNQLKLDTTQQEKQLQNGWEISAASEKLAECQETILNLGKQLKALASPKETVLLDKVISSNTTNNNHHSSLLDKILGENGIEPDDANDSPKMKEIICTMDSQKASTHLPETKPPEHYDSSNETRYKSDATAAGALAIIPSKQQGGGGISLLRKLLSRRKSSRRMSLNRK